MASPGFGDGLSSCSSSDSEFHGENSEDLSFSELDTIPEFIYPCADVLKSLQIDHNSITVLPRSIALFKNLITLDLSNNQMTHLSSELCSLTNLRTLSAKNNLLDTESVPKDFGNLQNLEVLNLSGNGFIDIPIQVTELSRLRSLYMGQNCLKSLPSQVKRLTRLQNLYLGGNHLVEIPAEVGYLVNLACLVLCDNRLQSLPPTLSGLRKLQSLSLHNNQLSTLPPEIVSLNLVELSLRNNPLIMKFVQDLVYNPPSLLELAGRTVKSEKVKYNKYDLPGNLLRYLDSAHRCVNPKCKGVYFSAKVEHVKFVDFCGKYRIPLMQYLCSPQCSTINPVVRASSESDTDDDDSATQKIRKVLLGLQNLYLGGNHLVEIPAEVGYLVNLACLVLCDNRLQSLPPTLSGLRKLQSLSLHNNQLSTLPPEIVSLNLVELSLRNNPLIMKFVQDLVYNPPSLLELAGRTVKSEKVKYNKYDLPGNLLRYLDSAHRCVNPKCKGVYFSAKVEHVKFVDFCGKYRIPLMQYLCSPQCSTINPVVRASSESDTDDDDSATQKIRKVLLG